MEKREFYARRAMELDQELGLRILAAFVNLHLITARGLLELCRIPNNLLPHGIFRFDDEEPLLSDEEVEKITQLLERLYLCELESLATKKVA